MEQDSENTLERGIEKLGLNFEQWQLDALHVYMQKVLEFNQSYNLMKADSVRELSVNHVLDSLVAIPYIKELLNEKALKDAAGCRIGDIGSGGGCPGIPLAVALPNVSFTLVERMEKRCVFLESAIGAMGLKNVKVECVQADLVKPESFDIAVFRAFHPFDKKILNTLFRLIKKDGYLVAFKARAQKIEEEMQGVKALVPEYKKIPLVVPFLEDHERHLVVIKK